MSAIDPRQMAPWKCPVWILTTPRTGSTLLCYRLNAAVGLPTRFAYDKPNPPRNVFGEHFHPDFRKLGYRPNTIRPYVTKFFGTWKSKLGTKRLWPETKFIHLTRRNFQAQVESRVLGELWGRWTCESPEQRLEFKQFAENAKKTEEYDKIFQHYIWECEEMRRLTQDFARTRPRGSVMEVAYEDIALHDQVGTLEAIFDFIGFKKGEYKIKLDVGLYKTGV